MGVSSELLNRLAEAESGSRELDDEIARALGWTVHNARRAGLWAVIDGRPYEELTTSDEDMAVLISIDCWTQSLDAALALAERLGLDVLAISNEATEGLASGGWSSSLRTLVPELARHACIAILRAKEASDA